MTRFRLLIAGSTLVAAGCSKTVSLPGSASNQSIGMRPDDLCEQCGPGGGPPPKLGSVAAYKGGGNYSGVACGAYGSKAIPTVDGHTQSFVNGNSKTTQLTAYGNGTNYLSGLPPLSAPFVLNNVTFRGYPNSYVITFTHAKAGSGVLWLDQTNWRFLMNFSFDKSRTYGANITSPRRTMQPDSAGTAPIWLGGIGIALGSIGVAAGIAALVGAAPELLAIGAVAGLVGLGLAVGAWIIDMGEYDPGSAFQTSPGGIYPMLMNPPDYNDGFGPWQFGGPDGSSDIQVT